MIITTGYSDISSGGSPMRMFVAAPKAEGKFPAILCYSDIFQLTAPMLRSCARLAGYDHKRQPGPAFKAFREETRHSFHRISHAQVDVEPWQNKDGSRGLCPAYPGQVKCTS